MSMQLFKQTQFGKSKNELLHCKGFEVGVPVVNLQPMFPRTR